MTAVSAGSPQQVHRWHAVAAASIGNALEWFDFAVFGFFAGTFAKLFFPADDKTLASIVAVFAPGAGQSSALLLTWLTFGITFLMRPLGAIALGVFADRYGRKSTLTLTIALMMVGTGLIAVAPTYAVAGLLAPGIIIVARLIQGFSAGGEFGSATAFLAEQNPARRGFFASWQFASQGFTTILASGFGALLAGLVAGGTLTPAQMDSWGWRTPFIFGLLIGPVAYYIRSHLEETTEFRTTKISDAPLRETFSDRKARLLTGLGLIVLSTVATYTIAVFMPSFAVRQFGLPPTSAYLTGLLFGVIQVVLIPVVGSLSDRIGRTPIALVCAIVLLFAIYPLFVWLTSMRDFKTLLAVQVIAGVLVAGYVGAIPALLADLFPTRLRTTGLSIAYSFAAAIFGGFAPFINDWLITATGSNVAVSFYLILAAAISTTALLAARRMPPATA